MKAMARHTGAAQSLIEDDSLQLMFHMVAMGVPTRNQGVTELADTNSSSPLHLAQLHRHVMQVCYFLNLNLSYDIFLSFLRRFNVDELLFCSIFSCVGSICQRIVDSESLVFFFLFWADP